MSDKKQQSTHTNLEESIKKIPLDATAKTDLTGADALEQILNEFGANHQNKIVPTTPNTSSAVKEGLDKKSKKKTSKVTDRNEVSKDSNKYRAGRKAVLIDSRIVRLLQFLYPDEPVSKTIDRILRAYIEDNHADFNRKVRSYLK